MILWNEGRLCMLARIILGGNMPIFEKRMKRYKLDT